MRALRLFASAIVLLVVLAPASAALAQQQGYYVLDKLGGVHAGGGAPVLSPQTPYFGFDVAKDVVYVPAGSSGASGVLVLDAFGGVHAGGALKGTSLAPSTPYFGFDAARAITVVRDTQPRAGTYKSSGNISVSNTSSYQSVASVSIYAPSPGTLLLTATAEVFCTAFGSAGNTVARLSLNVDSTAGTSLNYPVGIEDCTTQTGPTYYQRTVTISAPFTVTAGSHTAYLLAINDGGSQVPIVSDRALSVVFVD